MKKIVKKIKFKFFKIKNNFYVLINKKNFKYKVAIISTNKFANKIKDDIYLKNALNHRKVQADILCWEDNPNLEIYDAIIIKSIWGYYEKLAEFIEWLDLLKKKNLLVLNNIDILKNNMDKEKQYDIFSKNEISCIETKFVNLNEFKTIAKEELNKYKTIIIKPTISESGKNFYMIKNISDIDTVYGNIKNIKSKLMIQPYLDFDKKEVKNIIVKEFGDSNVLVGIKSIDKMPSDIEKLASKVISCEEYKDSFYGRIDIVLSDKPYIMEAEFLDPSWYMYVIKDKDKLKKLLDNISIKIIKHIENKK